MFSRGPYYVTGGALTSSSEFGLSMGPLENHLLDRAAGHP
jgi:hypothetical protein